jgi:fructose-1,6-bisphosphatase II / sedoheptulose-1,7-bisphosphatase
MAPAGGFLNAPDVYMDKIAVGGGLPAGIIAIDAPPAENLRRIAEAKGIPVEEVAVMILDRPRHEQLIQAVRDAGARIRLISDGDVAGVIATARAGAGIDIYMGSGGAPEGVLAAAALRCIGGQFQGRLMFRNDAERSRARKWGVTDLNRIYHLEDLAQGDVMFTATGVTDGAMLKGVRRVGDKVFTESIVMRSKTGTVRIIESEHNLPLKSGVVPHFHA